MKNEKMSSYQRWYYKNHERVKEQKRQSMRRRRAADPERYRKQYAKAKEKIRNSLFDMYGHECAACGFDDKRALTLDHILNNGAQERKELGERGVYYRARDTYLPNEYQILCMNCQFIKAHEDGRRNQHGNKPHSAPPKHSESCTGG